ncbi:MAG: alpha/beta fold hydrolase [Ruminococcus sp.]|nr:alpha/beta fold hydrolase [Ruminococcus sp.]
MLNADTREFEFTSDFDGLVVSAVIAAPSGNVNGVVQIVHGMNEYKERYFPFMDYLAEEGFITVIHDNRGHGKSICSPDDLGFMYRAGGKGFVSDIAQLNGIIKKRFPELPLFLIGHSMGSLGARCFLKDHDDQIGGLVVLGCPCYSRFSGFARSIESALSKGLGSRFRSEKIDEAAEKMLGKGFENVPHSWICSDPEVVEKFNADPMCNFKYTLNGYEGLLWLMKETYSKKGWQVKNPRLPIRFVSGKDDPCMLSEKKFFKAMDTLEKVGYESISHRFFDGMRHEVLNEKNSMNVYKDIAKTLFSWIDRIHEQEAQAMMSAPQQEAQPTHEPIAMPEDVFEALEETTEQVPVPTSAESVMEEKKQAAADAQAQVMQLLESVSPTSSDEN